MSKQLSPLKSAIQGLKINTPFDLRKQGQVALTPPPVEPKAVESRKEPPQKEQPRIEPTQDEVPPVRETRVQVPQVEVPKRAGFFRLAHEVFADAELRALSGDAFRLFVWMSSLAWRYQDSDGTLRASVNFMVNGTGVSHATISRALGQLRERGLAELVQTDFKRGNVWKVSRRAVYQTDPEGPQNEGPKDDGTPPSKRGSSDLNLREKPSRNEVEIRNSKNPKKAENSLSRITDETLIRYFAELKPAGKRESEWVAFEKLRADYPEDQVAQALEHLQHNGVSQGGEFVPCHSPMAYLLRAMPEVLALAETQQKLERARQDRMAREVAERDAQARADQKAAEEWAIQERAFYRSFPSEERRLEVIAEICRKLGVPPRGQVAKNMAVSAWWSGLSQYERKEVSA
jgi:hypothetical protein